MRKKMPVNSLVKSKMAPTIIEAPQVAPAYHHCLLISLFCSSSCSTISRSVGSFAIFASLFSPPPAVIPVFMVTAPVEVAKWANMLIHRPLCTNHPGVVQHHGKAFVPQKQP